MGQNFRKTTSIRSNKLVFAEGKCYETAIKYKKNKLIQEIAFCLDCDVKHEIWHRSDLMRYVNASTKTTDKPWLWKYKCPACAANASMEMHEGSKIHITRKPPHHACFIETIVEHLEKIVDNAQKRSKTHLKVLWYKIGFLHNVGEYMTSAILFKDLRTIIAQLHLWQFLRAYYMENTNENYEASCVSIIPRGHVQTIVEQPEIEIDNTEHKEMR